MPELPEVEFGRGLAESVAVGRRIVRAWCARDTIVFDGPSPSTFRRALEGRRVDAVHRRGKHLWMALDKRPWPLFHFGMTGAFRVVGQATLKLASHGQQTDDSWPPRFAKLRLHFEDGGELVMTNARRLGRIRLRDDPPNEAPINKLGFDALTDLPSESSFLEAASKRRVAMKGLLLDQKFAAGVGNWIADEVLYQARIDPRRRACQLNEKELLRVRRKLAAVIQKAVAVDAVKTRFPKSWLFHHRWGKMSSAKTDRGDHIAFETVAGRTTAWVPSIQH